MVVALEAGGDEGPVHFDYKPRTEDDDGVWASAAACMRNYLILRAKMRAFRADAEVAEALRAARVGRLAEPTMAAGDGAMVPLASAIAARRATRRRATRHGTQHGTARNIEGTSIPVIGARMEHRCAPVVRPRTWLAHRCWEPST